jgi:hypothetical protein
MPMNLIKPYSGLQYPDSSDLKPLIETIDFESEFGTIMNFVFGKIVIVRSMNHFRPPPQFDQVVYLFLLSLIKKFFYLLI